MNSLQRTLKLTRVMLKSGTGMEGGGQAFGRKRNKNRTPSKIGGIFLYVFLFAYLVFISFFMAKSLAPTMIALNMDRAYFELFLGGYALITILLGFFSTFSTLAFSQDQERLSSMPFKRGEILIARMIMIFLTQTIFPLLTGIPIFFTYFYYKGSAWTFYVKAVLAMVLQIIVPVSLMVIASLILIRITPLAKNKDRFMIFAQVITIVLVMFVVFSGQNLSMGMEESQAIDVGNLPTGLFPTASKFVPNIGYLRDFMMLEGSAALINFIKFFAVALVFVVITYLIANELYRPHTSSGGKNKQLSSRGVEKTLRPKSPFGALLAKELRLIRRNPTILTNNILGALLFPIFMLVPLGIMIYQEGGFDLAGLRGQIASFFQLFSGWEYQSIIVVVASLILAIIAHFISGVSALNSSAVSREGEDIIWTLIWPVSLEKQYRVKSLVSYVVVVLPYLLMFLAAILILGIPMKIAIIPMLVYLLSSYNANKIALLIDASKPVLDWENEIYPIKSNKRIFLSMLLNWLLAGIFGFLIYLQFTRFEDSPETILAIIAVITIGVLIVLEISVPKILRKTMSRIERYT